MSHRTHARTLSVAVATAALLAPLGLAAPASAAGEAPEAKKEGPSFVDPTATVRERDQVQLGELVYVAPFAKLLPGGGNSIEIGDESNVQDSVLVDARRGSVTLGEQTILAHGAAVKGEAAVGEGGSCPDGEDSCPSFVGFNALVDGGTVEKDAMISALARVGRGVTIPSGRKVLPGKSVDSQQEVEQETAPVTEADREFMRGVIEVNLAFARQYPKLAQVDPRNVHGANFDPGRSEFNERRDLPSVDGRVVRDPDYRNRIIGDVRLHEHEEHTSGGRGHYKHPGHEVETPLHEDARWAHKNRLRAALRNAGDDVSLRADEGEPFEVGTVREIEDNATFHALEGTHLHLGDRGRYGERSLVHGGPTPYEDTTLSGDGLRLADGAILFRSRVGDDVRIGERSVVQQSDLRDGTHVPARTVMVENKVVGTVEW